VRAEVLKKLRAGFSGGARSRAAKKAEFHCGVCRLDFKEEAELHHHALALHLRPVFACQLCHFKVFFSIFSQVLQAKRMPF
jgi:hypothetical protein